jgi:hypothetical protein
MRVSSSATLPVLDMVSPFNFTHSHEDVVASCSLTLFLSPSPAQEFNEMDCWRGVNKEKFHISTDLVLITYKLGS